MNKTAMILIVICVLAFLAGCQKETAAETQADDIKVPANARPYELPPLPPPAEPGVKQYDVQEGK